MKIVAIGASAGGIEAFRLFFGKMPADSGLGFVVVLHTAADRKSLLAEILSRWTQMSVSDATDNERVEPDHVYVIPPGYVASLRNGRLSLRHLLPEMPREASAIDSFFDSMAVDLGEDAIGIVLSGTGHDGALGLKAIKARGGYTLAQGRDGTAPQHSGMPDSAIATGAVDAIAAVQDMPQLLLAANGEVTAEGSAEQIETARLRICAILRDRVGHDFSHYKDKTFLRRVQRRMQVLELTQLSDYTARLETDNGEAVLLFRDLLIGVTTFFRDANTFEAVKDLVLPRLFAGKSAADHIRIWVPGCATGEEAYSLAMLLCEHMHGVIGAPKVQIFATDIDEAAIATARAGRYPTTLLDGLSSERTRRFFNPGENSYVVSKEIRDLCTFSTHSLVKDPPFSRMNLVSCRNLLIYLDSDLQAMVVPAFHYSLQPGGLLLLGSSETVARHDELFAPLAKEHRIFLRREVPTPTIRVPSRLSEKNPTGFSTRSGLTSARRGGEGKTDWTHALSIANGRVLERYAAPFALVTEDGSLLHYSSHAGGFLQPALGPPSRNIFDLVRQGLRHGLRTALREAVASGRTAELTVLQETDGRTAVKVTLAVEPLPGQEPDRPYLVVFKEAGVGRIEVADLATGQASAATAAYLERELLDTREQFQSLTEEHETALEEVRSTNEELHSVNEELQSSNEELETSKEEIQSVNEELQTVNAQLHAKVDELDRANSDLRNLFESTRVATVFLDPHMIIRAFTPEVCNIYNLIPSDRGRPLTDIVSRLDYDDLRDDILHVLHSLEPLERQVSRQDATAHYLLRILPYRAPDSTVEGALITFVDVTEITKAEHHQRLLVDELNHRVRNMLSVVTSLALRTLRSVRTLEGFSGVFLGRVQALTAAYSLLSRESWTTVQLREVLSEELKPFMAADRCNIQIEGPDVALDPRGALALGLAVHELATNAVKYGALSMPEGDVELTWRLEEGIGAEMIVLDWTERHGPPVVEPEHRGFGSTLVERGLAHDLSGEARIEFHPEGVRARLTAPLRRAPVPTPIAKFRR